MVFTARLREFHAKTKAACCPPGERACRDAVESEGAVFCRLGGECTRPASMRECDAENQ
jgi:hypothetical protein